MFLFVVNYLLIGAFGRGATQRPSGCLALAFALTVPFIVRGQSLSLTTTESQHEGHFKRLPKGYLEMGRLVSRRFRGQDEVAIGEAGLVPYEAMAVRFMDLLGLVDEDMARQPGGMHQRVHIDHFLERAPTAVIFAHLTVQPPYGPYQYGPELLSNSRFHSAYRRVELPRELKEPGWAMYLRRNDEPTLRQLAWSKNDDFVDMLGPSR